MTPQWNYLKPSGFVFLTCFRPLANGDTPSNNNNTQKINQQKINGLARQTPASHEFRKYVDVIVSKVEFL